MPIATVQAVLLYSTIINFAVLALWVVLMALPRRWMHDLWGRLTGVTPGQFDAMSFAGILFYKVLTVLFNLVPYIALRIATAG